MPKVMQFFALEIFECTITLRPGDVDKIRRAKENILDSLVETPEIVEGVGGSPDDVYANRWFRSPWTLQETCVRPDMLLADANFKFLSATTDYPVAINDIAAMLVAIKSLPSMGNVQSLPRAAMLTLSIFQNVGLDHLVSIKPIAIIMNDKAEYKLEPRGKEEEGEARFFDQTLKSNRASNLMKRGGTFRGNHILSNGHESAYPG